VSLFPPLYAILDRPLVPVRLLPLAETLASAGVQLIQLRDKHSTASRIHAAAMELTAHLSPRGVRLVVNDRPDVAAIVSAGGVHVGQEDLPVEEARRICGSSLWVGVSTHNLEQVHEAALTSADYIAVGPIFSTATKANLDPVVGVGLLKEARRLTEKPLVAIGGVSVGRAEELYRAGADSLAVISDLLQAPDPALRAREYLEIAARVRSEQI
jgi:thiamine-phosphate pyrophosphorylase